LKQGQDSKIWNYWLKKQKQYDNGQRQVSISDGLQMAKGDMPNNYGKWQGVYLKSSEVSREYEHRKVWRYGLEVAMKIKASQGNRRVEWLKPEHPYTAICDKSDIHANHNEANNSALRRRCSSYRRRQNLYAKNTEGLERTVTVQRLVHNWVRPHLGLGKNKTPVMAIGLYHRPISMLELLLLRGFSSLTL
jgi:hypothetical protein